MKTLLGFVALVLYTCSMLAWGHEDVAKLCRAIVPTAPRAPLACAETAPERVIPLTLK